MLRTIKIGDSIYNVKITNLGPETVGLTLVAGNEYACHMTPAEAKRIAYALLLAADGIDP